MREAVGVAQGGRADDLDRHAQIGHHAADDGELLEVLLAEHRHVRARRYGTAGDHGGHALEMPGAEIAIEDARQIRHLDARAALGAVRIDLVSRPA